MVFLSFLSFSYETLTSVILGYLEITVMPFSLQYEQSKISENISSGIKL
jgi:hypothetical protein